jgi:hypothetical protein
MNDLERRVRISAGLVIGGLAVEAFSFGWHHPTAFIVFFVVGGLLLAAGMVSYLFLVLAKGG